MRREGKDRRNGMKYIYNAETSVAHCAGSEMHVDT